MNSKNNTEKKNNIDSISKLNELYKFMLDNNLEELEVKDTSGFVRIKRRSKKSNKQQMFIYPNNIYSLQPQPVSKIEDNLQNTEKIITPLNGVFYRAASPTTKPFVEEGDIIEPGAILCIIEAMKVMNEIRAEKKCKIIKILIENGTQVTQGQEIFIIQPV